MALRLSQNKLRQSIPLLASSSRFVSSVTSRGLAVPHIPASVPSSQAPNRETTWSENQATRAESLKGPRFEQTAHQFQPRPLAAIELIADEPIRLISGRRATCDGGGGALGHPKVFINLDKPGPKACNYCGIRFEQDHDHHH